MFRVKNSQMKMFNKISKKMFQNKFELNQNSVHILRYPTHLKIKISPTEENKIIKERTFYFGNKLLK